MKRPLPNLIALTDHQLAASAGRTVVDTVAQAIDGGLRAVVVREKSDPIEERRSLGETLVGMMNAVKGIVLVGSTPDLALEIGAAGVHLAAKDEWAPGGSLLVGRSVHNASELAAAIDDRVDYVTVSPVFESTSKPGYGPAIGVSGLAEAACVPAAPPIYALGGVTADNAHRCKSAGAVGVAVMGAIMAAQDPAAATAKLLQALDGLD